MQRTTLEPCTNCGSIPELRVTYGGFDKYFAVHCQCGRNTRGKGIMKGLLPLGMGSSSDAPQNSKEEAIAKWREINTPNPLETSSEHEDAQIIDLLGSIDADFGYAVGNLNMDTTPESRADIIAKVRALLQAAKAEARQEVEQTLWDSVKSCDDLMMYTQGDGTVFIQPAYHKHLGAALAERPTDLLDCIAILKSNADTGKTIDNYYKGDELHQDIVKVDGYSSIDDAITYALAEHNDTGRSLDSKVIDKAIAKILVAVGRYQYRTTPKEEKETE